MQEKEHKVSTCKQRISQYVEYLGITQRAFYEQTGISRGTLGNATGISEDSLTKLFNTYRKLSPRWVILGEGEMELKGFADMQIDRNEPDTTAQEPTAQYNKKARSLTFDDFLVLLNERDKQLINLARENGELRAEIKQMKKQTDK